MRSPARSIEANRALHRVKRSGFNAATFKPYDPADATGSVSPTTPKPPKAAHHGCGVFGQILLAVIAIAVTVIAPTGLPVVDAVLASTASQAVGVATGIQDKFSFKQVALAGISAGVAGGVSGAIGGGAVAGSQFVGDVVRGVATSAITQGIGVATGLQSKFDFVGVAAAGIGAGVGAALGSAIGLKDFRATGGLSARNLGASLLTGTASALANAATRSIANGSDFGDNIMAALPDVIGNTIGNAIGGEIAAGDDGEHVIGQFASADTGVRSDAPTAEEQALADYYASQDIVVTARRLSPGDSHKRPGFFDVLDSVLGTNLGGHHPHSRSNKASSSSSASSIVSGTIQFGRGFGYDVYDTGKNTIIGTYEAGRFVLTHNPGTTFNATIFGIAGVIDRGIAANNTPTIEYLRRAGTYLSTASAFDLGQTANTIIFNVALAAAPGLAAGKIASVGRLGELGLDAAESTVPSKLAQGLQFEANGVSRASTEAFLPGQSTQRLSVRAFNADGTLAEGRTVLDMAGYRLDNGELGALEFKLSPDAPYTARQELHFPLLEQNGGVVVGRNGQAIGLRAGARIAPTAPVRINGPTLPQPGGWWKF